MTSFKLLDVFVASKQEVLLFFKESVKTQLSLGQVLLSVKGERITHPRVHGGRTKAAIRSGRTRTNGSGEILAA